jgi:carbohydrate-selective porin OprB
MEYAIALGRRLTVQPDIRYVINPGGVSSVGNAVVLGAQVGINSDPGRPISLRAPARY